MRSSHLFILFPLSTLFYVEITSVLAQGIFPPTYQGTASLVGTTIYYAGGRNSTNPGLPSLFSLDLASSFSTSSPPWQVLPSLSYGISECSSWAFEGWFLIEGGVYQNLQNTQELVAVSQPLPNDVVMFNVNWSLPALPPRPFTQRRLHATAIDQETKIVYIVGGTSDIYTGTAASECGGQTGINCLQQMPYSIDLGRMIWAPLSIVGAPSVWKHSMVIVSSLLYIIGGEGASLDEIPTYNTITNTWSYTISNSESPLNRTGCSASLHQDKKTIIMYGGLVNSTPVAELWHFDTSTSIWKNMNAVGGSAVAFHSAIIVSDELLIIAGSTSVTDLEGSSSFFILNTTTGQAIDTFIPSPLAIQPSDSIIFRPTTSPLSSSPTETASQLPPQPDGNGHMVIAIACAVAAGLLVAEIIYVVRVIGWRRKIPAKTSSITPDIWTRAYPDDLPILAAPAPGRPRPIPPPHQYSSGSSQFTPLTTEVAKPDEIDEKVGISTMEHWRTGGWKINWVGKPRNRGGTSASAVMSEEYPMMDIEATRVPRSSGEDFGPVLKSSEAGKGPGERIFMGHSNEPESTRVSGETSRKSGEWPVNTRRSEVISASRLSSYMMDWDGSR